jgi:hypothetical protein
MPRLLKWTSAALALAAAVIFTIAVTGSGDKPLTIRFIGFTNASYADRPLAVFVATNTNSRTLTYSKHIERKSDTGWPIYFGPLPHNDSGYHDVPAGEAFRLLEYPPRDNEPWRISVVYSVRPSWWGERRWRIAEFFYDRNHPALGRVFHEGVKCYFAVGPEMHK